MEVILTYQETKPYQIKVTVIKVGNKLVFTALLVISLILFGLTGWSHAERPLGMAVEFMDHAACAYVAKNKGWFKEAGLNLKTYESYVTGMALASALARGDIEVAYICLVPAINAYANAKVPIKIVAGTHKYGYGLVVDPTKIKTVKDLVRSNIRIGCVREGGAVDVLLRRVVDKYHLDKDKILGKIQRMNPPKQVLAIKMGHLDAAFLPEHHATMAEEFGFQMLLTSQDIWPMMQGSVLVVKQDLIRSSPQIVKALVKVSQEATEWINQHPDEAAKIITDELQIAEEDIFPLKLTEIINKLKITPKVIRRSMDRLDYTISIDPRVIQDTIEYLAELGYIRKGFKAEEILDLRFNE